MYRCICGREFKTEQIYSMHKPYCKGPQYCQNPDCGKLLTGHQKKFCSASCSAKITVKGRKLSEETKVKISKSLGGNKKDFSQNKCLNCGININSLKFCSIVCQHKYSYKENVRDWLSNPEKYTAPKYFMKQWLIEQKGEKCHRCGWNETNIYTNKIPVGLHHEDGNWRNNFPENLDLVCGNCHSLTKTYRFGNRGNGRKVQREYYRGKTSKKNLPVAKMDVATDF